MFDSISSLGELFASCSDDRTVKIWNPDNGECIKTLTEHTREVYTLKWSPESPMILATGSFDSTVKIWDVGGTPSETSSFECLHTMKVSCFLGYCLDST